MSKKTKKSKGAVVLKLTKRVFKKEKKACVDVNLGADVGAPAVPAIQVPVLLGSLSLIKAAAMVLGDAPGGLNCPVIVKLVTERGLWTPGAGKTPVATLHAAICTEIKKKGDASRFVKVGRGLFTIKK